MPPEQAGGKPIDASARDAAVQEIEDFRTGSADTTGTGTGTKVTTNADGTDAPAGNDFESVDRLGTVAKELQAALGASILQAAPGQAGAAPANPQTPPPGSGKAAPAAAKVMAFRDMLTVTALDFRIDMHVAAGTPAPTVGGGSPDSSGSASPFGSSGSPDRHFLAILRRGTEQFDILSWREVAQ